MRTGKAVTPWVLFSVAAIQQILMSGTYISARYVLQQIDPFAVAFLRFVLAAAILYPIGLIFSRQPNAIPITTRDKKLIVILGLVIIIGNQTMYLCGQKLTSAAHGALLFSITPMLVYIMAMRHLKETWSHWRGIGIVLTVWGSALIVFGDSNHLNHGTIAGDMIIIIAVIAWAIYTVYGKPLVEKYGAFRVTAYALASGTVFYLPFGLYRLVTADMSQVDSYGWIAIVYMAIITSVIGYSVWYWLLKYMEASRAVVLTSIQPIAAGLLGIYLLKEPLTPVFITAGLVVITGVVITQKS